MKRTNKRTAVLLILVFGALPIQVSAAAPALAPDPASDLTQQQTRELAAEPLRIRLDRLFGEQALLAAAAMQKQYDSAPDAAPAREGLMEQSAKLADAVESVYGEAASQSFLGLWQEQNSELIRYAAAAAANDADGREAAAAKLGTSAEALGAWIAPTAASSAQPSDPAGLFRPFGEGLRTAFDAYAAGDAAGAGAKAREAYKQAFQTGDRLYSLAAAQLPGKSASAQLSSSALQLRAGLGRLLSEHAGLTAQSMQRTYQGLSDRTGSGPALELNTEDLAAGVTAVYGKAAGEAFIPLWRARIASFDAYAAALKQADEGAEAAAVEALEQGDEKLAQWIAGLGPDHLAEEAIADALKAGAGRQRAALDAYAKQDYAATIREAADGYDRMFDTAELLAEGIASQFPEQFPEPVVTGSVQGQVWMELGSPDLHVNGRTVRMDAVPEQVDGILYIPLRYAAEAVGGAVTWDGATRTAWLKWKGSQSAFAVQGTQEGAAAAQGGSPILLRGSSTLVRGEVFTEVTGWKLGTSTDSIAITLIPPVQGSTGQP